MPYDYDDQNIFAKILRGEIPNNTVLETDHTLAFHDIAPSAPVHVLAIPKGRYVNFDHFCAEASDDEITDFFRCCAQLAQELGVSQASNGDGYRVISNAGPDARQDVPHFHLHLLGGNRLGPMIVRPR